MGFLWNFYKKILREAQKSLPFQGRWLGGTPRRRGCSKFATTSQSALRLTAPLEGEPRVQRTPMPSPMRGRWHGEAVTDEVGAAALTRRCPPHQSALRLTASPHRGSHGGADRAVRPYKVTGREHVVGADDSVGPLRRGNPSGATRQLPLTRGALESYKISVLHNFHKSLTNRILFFSRASSSILFTKEGERRI